MIKQNDVSPVFLLDESGVILNYNKKACELTGFTDVELVGKDAIKLFPGHRNNVVFSERTNHFISQLTTKKGSKITVVGISSSFTQKDCLFYYLTLFNISVMAIQTDEDRLTTMKILTGYIAHDFNNMLSGIMGSLSLLREGIDNKEEFNMVLDNAEAGTERIKNLVSKMLAFSKGEITSIIGPDVKLKSEEQIETESKQTTKHCSGKILLMEDNSLVASTSAGLLKALGYCHVDVVKDSEEAIKLFKEKYQNNDAYTAVILDLTVTGGLGGLSTIKFLTEIDNDVTAIISSGYHNDEVMINYQRYGFKSALNKPYNIRELFLALEAALNSKE